MFFKKPPETIRSRVTLDEIDGLRIHIPALRQRFLMVFLGIWLIGWLIGEVMAIVWLVTMALGFSMNPGRGFQGPNAGNVPMIPFLIFWVTGWTLGGLAVMDALLWQLRGREWIRIDPDGEFMTVQRLGTLFPRRTRIYPLSEIRNLRYGPLPLLMFPMNFRDSIESQLQWLGTAGGSIAFDRDGRTRRFGSLLSETESRRLIKTIREHYKILDDQDEPLPVERL